MKIMLLAALTSAAVRLPAQARTAVLLDFTRATQAQSKGEATEIQGGPEPEAGSAVQRELSAFMAQTPQQETTSPQVDAMPKVRIGIPGWMRGKASRAVSFGMSSIPFAAIAEGCTWEPYRPNPRLKLETERRRARYYGLVAAAACDAGVPTHLLDALVVQESRYNPAARSPKGAIGMSQLMPGTARQLGVRDPWNVVDNVRGGARYLRVQLDEFKRYDLALGAYNAGPGRIRQYGRVPAYRETLSYVSTILQDVRWAIAQGPVVPVPNSGLATRPTIRTATLSQFWIR